MCKLLFLCCVKSPRPVQLKEKKFICTLSSKALGSIMVELRHWETEIVAGTTAQESYIEPQ